MSTEDTIRRPELDGHDTLDEAARKRERRRWIALGVLCLGQLMMVLDATIVNVALPSIQRDLHFTQANLTWVIDGYLITFGGFLLLAGRFGDLVGRKKVFLSGLVLFTAASILCGVADSQAMLIGARLIQGIGGAVASSVILAIIVTEFPQKVEQAKAMGMYAFVSAGGGSIGLLAGGDERVHAHRLGLLDLLRELGDDDREDHARGDRAADPLEQTGAD